MKWQAKLSVAKTPRGARILVPSSVEVLNQIDEEKTYTVEIKEYRKKRSLTANSYCWVLCQRLAEELSKNGTYLSREDVYRTAVVDSTYPTVVTLPHGEIERFTRMWEGTGIGYIVKSVAKHKEVTELHCYYGSSSYDTKQMARLLDCLIAECKELGIEHKNPLEVKALLEEWER